MMMDMGREEAWGAEAGCQLGYCPCKVNSEQQGCTHGDNGFLGLQHVRDDTISDDEEDMVL